MRNPAEGSEPFERKNDGWRITGFTYTSKLTRGNVDVWRHLPE